MKSLDRGGKPFSLSKLYTMKSGPDSVDNSPVQCGSALGFDPKDIRVRLATELDSSAIARLHAEGITEGFLSTLGLRFLSALYAGIIQAPRSGVLVATRGEAVLGFIAFTADIDSCYKWILTRRLLKLAFALLPNLLNPSIYLRIYETLRYPTRTVSSANGKHAKRKTGRSELLAMAVSDQVRGQGIGKALIAAMARELRRLGAGECWVVTHAIDERSNRFYQGCGFCLIHSFQNHGKPMNAYLCVLTK